MLGRLASIGLVSLLVAQAGCTTKRTEVFMGIMTNLTACDGVRSIKLEVFGGPGLDIVAFSRDYALSGDNCPAQEINLPGSFGISADDNARARIVVSARAGDGNMIIRESIISLVKEKTLFMRVAIVDECKAMACGAGQTCIEGICRPIPISMGAAPPGMPLTLTPRQQVSGAATFFEQRLLPEYRAGMENEIQCNSGAAIAPYRYSNPNPPPGAPQNWDPILPQTGMGCPANSFCEEGTCYKLPTPDGINNDAGLGSAWQPVTLTPGTDGGVLPTPGAYPEANQAVAAGNRFLVWGGRGPGGAPLFDTLALEPSPSQSKLTVFLASIGDHGSPTSPLPELGATTYDSDRQRVMTYRTNTTDGLAAELVELDVSGSAPAWSIVGNLRISPPPREHARIVYDPIAKKTVLFGGTCTGCCTDSAVCCSSGALCDTWTYDGTGWNLLQPAVKPPGRRDGALVFHAGAGKVMLFGGSRGPSDPACDDTRPNDLYCNDTWLLDTVAGTWSRVTAPFMGNLVDGVLLYDDVRNRALWMNFPANSPVNAPSEIFAFDGTTWSLATSFSSAPALRAFSALFHGPSNSIYVFGGTDDAGGASNLWRAPLP